MLLKVEPVPLQLNVANGLYLKIASNLADLNNAVVARASLGLGSLATVNDAPSDGTIYGRQNGAWAASSVLPVVDETAIVFETGVPANTLTFDVSAYTAAHVVAWPDAAMTVAGLEVANVFTAAQMVDGAADAIQLLVQANATQTNPVMVIETSAGADIFEVSNDYKLSVRDVQAIFVPNQTDFSRTFVVGNGGGALSHSAGAEGQFNLLVGLDAGRLLSTGNNNMFLGTQAGDKTTTGSNNAFIGTQAGFGNITSSNATAIGDLAGSAATGGGYVFIGSNAGLNAGAGSRSVIVGRQAGYNATGSDCVLLGYQAGYNETGSNRLYIANTNTATPLIYGQFDTGLLKFHTVDIGTTTAPNVVSLVHLSSGTPAANFGASLRFGLESSTTEDQNAARLAALWQTATHASRVADLVAYVSDSAGEVEIWRGRAGAAPLFGVLGATPVVRQAHIADPAGGGTQDAEARTAINSILNVLENFGFVATS